MKLRTKSNSIEAVQWDGRKGLKEVPEWISKAIQKEWGSSGSIVRHALTLEVWTPEGEMLSASSGDWVIRYPDGALGVLTDAMLKTMYEEMPTGGIGKYGFTNPIDKLHPEEPYFFLRAQDMLSIPLLEEYRKLTEDIGEDTDSLDELLESFEAWQVANADKVKRPD